MLYKVDRLYKNEEIRIPIQTRKTERIVVRAFHPDTKNMPNTVYFNAAPIITGVDCISIKIPRMPAQGVCVAVYNDRIGNVNGDNTFRIGKISVLPIKQIFSITNAYGPLSDLMNFIDEFAEKKSVLSATPGIYKSEGNKITIDYVPTIRDENGRELATPMRANTLTKVLQVSQKGIKNYTVPGTKMWLYHELSHLKINKNPADEFEADKNAIMFYLGTGNPIIEAYNHIFKVFKNTPSDLNKQRYIKLKAYIDNFHKRYLKKFK